MAAFLANREFWVGKRVLLTGHTGFKGSWLALWLSELGAHISGIGLEPDTRPNLFTQLDLVHRLKHHYLVDIRDANNLADIVMDCQPEVVFHLAGQPLVRRSYQDPLSTWATNVMGSLHLLEALRPLKDPCAVVMITTDKVYANREWDYGYRENDRLGGHDPYSASKAAAELAIDSWRASFCGAMNHQVPHLFIATARAGNVIGGGDWSDDRIMPDVIKALSAGEPITLRNPAATRPWQHVLEPLGGYLLLAERLFAHFATNPHGSDLASAFNFGPAMESNQSVQILVEAALQHWSGSWLDRSDFQVLHEAGRLHLHIDKAYQQLGWQPRWDFATTVSRTVAWYRAVSEGGSALGCCLADIHAYQE